jgi:hypothetical protein
MPPSGRAQQQAWVSASPHAAWPHLRCRCLCCCCV